MTPEQVEIPPRPYQARIENGLLPRAGALLADFCLRPANFLCLRSRLCVALGSELLKSLVAASFKAQVLQIPDGEPAKKLATIETIAEPLVRLGADRKSVLIALGGGGLAAGCLMEY